MRMIFLPVAGVLKDQLAHHRAARSCPPRLSPRSLGNPRMSVARQYGMISLAEQRIQLRWATAAARLYDPLNGAKKQ